MSDGRRASRECEAHPDKKRPAQALRDSALRHLGGVHVRAELRRLFVGRRQQRVVVSVVELGREEPLVERERAALALGRAKAEADKDLAALSVLRAGATGPTHVFAQR